MAREETSEHHKKHMVCPNCGKNDCFIVIHDEIVCYECGTVVGVDIISTEAPPIYGYENFSLKSNNPVPKPIYVNLIKPMSVKIKEQDKTTRNHYCYEEKFKLTLINKVNEYINKLNLSEDIKDLTLWIIYNYFNKLKSKQRKLKGIVAAALYISLRIRDIPKPLDVICKELNLKKRDLIKAYKRIRTTLNLKVAPLQPEKYIKSFGRELNLSKDCINLALKIVKKVKETKGAYNSEPRGVAAAALYYASELMGETREKKEIADIASITELTVRKKYNEIKRVLDSKFAVN